MHVALLVNPTARSGTGIHAARRAEDRLRAGGIRTTTLAAAGVAESTRLLRSVLDAGVDAVLAAGGDGTVNLAIQELAGGSVPLGIIPVGTGNDLATTLGLRDLDATGAADAVAAGTTRTIDLARVTQPDGSVTRYGTVLAAGFDSRVNDRANRMRWPRGAMRYNIALLVEFAALRGVPFTIDLEHEDGTAQRLDRDLIMATVGNGRTYGGGIPICPDADLTDGLLDLTLVRTAGRLHLLRLLPHAYRGTHTGLDEVTTLRVRSVRLTAPGVTAYADGDPLGALPLRIDAEPQALTVFAPA